MNTKTCTKCGIDKPLNDYNNRKDSKDGKRSDCKECVSVRGRLWREANSERKRASSRAWAEANRKHKNATNRLWRETNLERERLKARQRAAKNKEHNNARSRAWAEANRERARARAKAWAKANPERHKVNVRARRARKAHTVPQQWKRTPCPDHLCYWCGTTLTPNNTHIDHIMPISLGGQDTPDNTANTCANCNLTKSNTHPLVWLARITSPDTMC